MQTPDSPVFRPLSTLRRATAALLAAVLLVATAACSEVRVAGLAESEQSSSPCELAYYAATDHTATMDGTDGTTILSMRYLAALQAQHDWLDVAIQCSQRFTEGTLRSAQAQYSARSMAAQLGQSYQPLTVNSLDDIDSMAITADALSSMALAEDRAGFETEVLGGIYASKAPTSGNAAVKALAANTATKLVAISDNHKECASQMMMIAGSGATDLRRKVYATGDLTASPYLIADPATGIDANTVAVAEINAARAELEAMSDNAYDASKLSANDEADVTASASSSASASTSSGSSDSASSDSASSDSASSDSASSDSASSDSSGASELRADLLQLSMLIATHAYTAFTLGYPSMDHFLFS
ncbi:hypothetical protein [Bifidobacterium choloepi]|uniref:hypothetical protein n=1 Tax=Bifidobacterium choloepi TaxID=2614131 RepID=UPI0013D396DB|nr:hypothetical protein [Bifidobacterium choloepi]